jgi:hypothetical protein
VNIDLTSITEQMPDFNSHLEAREWFTSQFPNRFLLRSEDSLEGKRVYYYHVVKNPEVYQQYMESFAKAEGHEITNPKTFESYSTVEISEDGDVSLSI